jgi:hypothetical protein
MTIDTTTERLRGGVSLLRNMATQLLHAERTMLADIIEALAAERDAARAERDALASQVTEANAQVARLRDLFRKVAPVVNAATWTKATRPLADELHAIMRAALTEAPRHD